MKTQISRMISAGAWFALAGAMAATPAHAGPAISLTNSFGCCATFPASMGWSFTANQNFTVDQLGFFDDRFDGLVLSHRVALWDVATRTIVVQGTVASGAAAPLVGGFRYVDVADTDLVAGRSYYAMAEFPGNATTIEFDSAFQVGQSPAGPITVDPRITLGDLRNAPIESSSFTTFPDETWLAHFGAGFLIADPTTPPAIPEPATLPLAFGAVGAACWVTRRTRRAVRS